MKRPQVIETDFRQKEKIDKDFKNCIGLYKDNIIYIEKDLPETYKSNKGIVYQHEFFHYLLEKKNIRFKNIQDEESVVECLSVVFAKDKFISPAEKLIQKYILRKKLNPTDFDRVLSRVLLFLDIKLI